MAREIILEPGRTFDEFVVHPNLTPRDCTITEISLEGKIAGIGMGLPLFSAAMTSVTGEEMALALGKEGGMGVLPARLPVDEQASMVRRIKNHEMTFVGKPIDVKKDATVEQVLAKINRYGHSEIPVVDRDNVFQGMFELQHYRRINVAPSDPVTAAMIPFDDSGNILYVKRPDISVEEAKKLLAEHNRKYLVVLDKQDRLRKLAFRQDAEKVKIASAIGTHPGWEKRVKANLDAGVDMIFIDTSDAHSEFTADVIKAYKAMGSNIPICAGNVVTYDGAIFLMKAGADAVKVGMSSGSICITARQKAVGRAPMTALIDVEKARDAYKKESGRYVPIIMDGGIANAANMVIALAVADGIMMGGYFNKFFDAAGPKLDEDKKPTNDEAKMRWVETWGEGSLKAQNLSRYGHDSVKTFFAEGIEGLVPYAGRLKPALRDDMLKVKAALSNVGCRTLDDFRTGAVLELNSPYASEIVKNPHDVEVKR